MDEGTFVNYWKSAKKNQEKKRAKIQKELEREQLNEEKDKLRTHLYDKASQTEILLDDINVMREEIRDLRKVKITGVKVGDSIIATTQSDVTQAKRAIASLQREINNTIEILSKWYGYNQPEDINIKGELSFMDFLKRNNQV